MAPFDKGYDTGDKKDAARNERFPDSEDFRLKQRSDGSPHDSGAAERKPHRKLIQQGLRAKDCHKSEERSQGESHQYRHPCVDLVQGKVFPVHGC